jgi:hypothetical protein
MRAQLRVFGPEANDAFGDALLIATTHYDGRAPVQAFVKIVARNRAITRQNHNHRLEPLEDTFDQQQELDPESYDPLRKIEWLKRTVQTLRAMEQDPDSTRGDRLQARRARRILHKMVARVRLNQQFAEPDDARDCFTRLLRRRGEGKLSPSSIGALFTLIRQTVLMNLPLCEARRFL